MKKDYIKTAQVTEDDIRRVRKQLDIKLLKQHVLINSDAIGDESRFGLSIREIESEIGRRLVAEIKLRIATKKLDVKIVRFPETWRDAVKEAAMNWCHRMGQHRLAKWIKARGINYTEVSMEANAYYPDLRIGDSEPYVDIAMSAERRKRLEEEF